MSNSRTGSIGSDEEFAVSEQLRGGTATATAGGHGPDLEQGNNPSTIAANRVSPRSSTNSNVSSDAPLLGAGAASGTTPHSGGAHAGPSLIQSVRNWWTSPGFFAQVMASVRAPQTVQGQRHNAMDARGDDSEYSLLPDHEASSSAQVPDSSPSLMANCGVGMRVLCRNLGDAAGGITICFRGVVCSPCWLVPQCVEKMSTPFRSVPAAALLPTILAVPLKTPAGFEPLIDALPDFDRGTPAYNQLDALNDKADIHIDHGTAKIWTDEHSQQALNKRKSNKFVEENLIPSAAKFVFAGFLLNVAVATMATITAHNQYADNIDMAENPNSDSVQSNAAADAQLSAIQLFADNTPYSVLVATFALAVVYEVYLLGRVVYAYFGPEEKAQRAQGADDVPVAQLAAQRRPLLSQEDQQQKPQDTHLENFKAVLANAQQDDDLYLLGDKSRVVHKYAVAVNKVAEQDVRSERSFNLLTALGAITLFFDVFLTSSLYSLSVAHDSMPGCQSDSAGIPDPLAKSANILTCVRNEVFMDLVVAEIPFYTFVIASIISVVALGAALYRLAYPQTERRFAAVPTYKDDVVEEDVVSNEGVEPIAVMGRSPEPDLLLGTLDAIRNELRRLTLPTTKLPVGGGEAIDDGYPSLSATGYTDVNGVPEFSGYGQEPGMQEVNARHSLGLHRSGTVSVVPRQLQHGVEHADFQQKITGLLNDFAHVLRDGECMPEEGIEFQHAAAIMETHQALMAAVRNAYEVPLNPTLQMTKVALASVLTKMSMNGSSAAYSASIFASPPAVRGMQGQLGSVLGNLPDVTVDSGALSPALVAAGAASASAAFNFS